jgi:hypothetical protein
MSIDIDDNDDPPYTLLNYDHDFIPTPPSDFLDNVKITVTGYVNWFRVWAELDKNVLYICCVSASEATGYILIYDIVKREEVKGKLSDLGLAGFSDEMAKMIK